jgi:uncharacterized membrane protein YccC
MRRVTSAWTWLVAKARDGRPQLLLCLRVTVAAIVSFVLAQFLAVPLAGLWAVLTSVVVTQMSLGGSLKAAVEYAVGTLGGAVYAGAVGALIPHNTELTLLLVLALAVAPLALLAAVNPNFRVGPFTAVLVVVGTSATHIDPIGSALYRVLEVALGGGTGLLVSLLVLPSRAQALLLDAAAEMLDLLADSLVALLAGFARPLEAADISRLQGTIGAAYQRIAAVGAEARREQLTYLAPHADPGFLLRMLLRLRHDLVMIGRAAHAPFPEPVLALLGPPLARVGEAMAGYLRACGSALAARHAAPTLEAVEVALEAYDVALAVARRDALLRDLPTDAVERVFAVGFALDQLHENFADLARCVGEYARPSAGSTADAAARVERARAAGLDHAGR